MNNGKDIFLLGGGAIRSTLEGNEAAVTEVIREAYSVYGERDCVLPHSTFLRFKDDPSNRIIALPAYLGGDFDIAGLKWVSSFPANIERGLDRASATLTLNDCRTGKPMAVLEASSINAHRTAASAALAARVLSRVDEPKKCALVGCGYIGFEALNYLFAMFPSIEEVVLVDTAATRAEHLAARLPSRSGGKKTRLAADVREIPDDDCEFVIFATSAGTPWLDDLSAFNERTVVLHISLRDLSAAMLLGSNNVVDDLDHVCRENTSVHLAAQASGNTNFVDAELPELIANARQYTGDPEKTTVFSPFGLGILDLALGKWVVDRARQNGAGEVISDFFPAAWLAEPDTVTSH